jgi:hypothetical protein
MHTCSRSLCEYQVPTFPTLTGLQQVVSCWHAAYPSQGVQDVQRWLVIGEAVTLDGLKRHFYSSWSIFSSLNYNLASCIVLSNPPTVWRGCGYQLDHSGAPPWQLTTFLFSQSPPFGPSLVPRRAINMSSTIQRSSAPAV